MSDETQAAKAAAEKVHRLERELAIAKLEAFHEHLNRATAFVATWPTWKQNILSDSAKPALETPRQPIVSDN